MRPLKTSKNMTANSSNFQTRKLTSSSSNPIEITELQNHFVQAPTENLSASHIAEAKKD